MIKWNKAICGVTNGIVINCVQICYINLAESFNVL